MEKTTLVREFPATDEAYAQVTEWVEGRMEELDCPPKIAMQIAMCLEEVFVNIAHYAYGEGTGNLNLAMTDDDCNLTLQFRDKGVAFDPLAKEDPDVTMKMEDRQIGGLGIFLVKEMMDDVRYERIGDENVLTFTKKIR